MIQLLTVVMALFTSATCLADGASLNSFFAQTLGSWRGDGTVQVQVPNGPVKTYPIQVELTSALASDSWSFTTLSTGMPGSGAPTTTRYQVIGDDLQVISSQYTALASVQSTTASELAMTTVHSDPVNGNSVTVIRKMTLDPGGSLRMLSDIYQNSRLVQHFDYSVQRVE